MVFSIEVVRYRSEVPTASRARGPAPASRHANGTKSLVGQRVVTGQRRFKAAVVSVEKVLAEQGLVVLLARSPSPDGRLESVPGD